MVNFLHTIFNTYDVPVDSFWHAGPFTLWHFIYIISFATPIILCAIFLRKKSDKTKKTVLDVLSIVVFSLYVFDLFVRPISKLEGDFAQSIAAYLDKLPFHICTVMGPLCLFAQHSKKFAKIKEPLVILGIVGPLMYLVYPNGVFGDAFPFCYNTFQTMLYHGVLIAWAILCLAFGQPKSSIKRGSYQFAICVFVASAWALFGNIVYSDMSSLESWNATGYDWFFQKSGAFYIAKGELWYAILAPIGVAIAVYLVGMIVYGIYHLIKKIASPRKKKEKSQAEKREYSSVA